MRKEINISELLFYLAYVPWILMKIIGMQTNFGANIDLNTLFEILKYACCAILIFKMFFDYSYTVKTILTFIILGFISIIIYINTTNIDILILFLLIYSAGNLSFKKIIRITMSINIVLMLFIISSGYLGIINNNMFLRSSGKIRYSLGYVYTTYAANYYFSIVLMYLYLKDEKKLKFKEVVSILLINFIIFTLTDTKAAFVLICIMTILAYVIGFIKKPLKNGFINRLAFEYCFPIATIISIAGIINYNDSNSIYIALNELSTYRLVLGKSAYEQFGISFLGQKITWITGLTSNGLGVNDIYNYVDSSYLNIAINYGIVILLIICIGYVFIGKYAIRNNKKYLCIVLLFLAIHSSTDPQLIEIIYDPFLLMLGIFLNTRLKKSYSAAYGTNNLYVNSKLKLFSSPPISTIDKSVLERVDYF